ncbi:ankyrin repeat-containing domain protein [Mycena rebaudengoi]|nr:ankyrin repeat-containing domain protein [Mycena rebaudengoi]
MSDKQHETHKLHHEGTGIWFLDGRQLAEWIEKPGSLWIGGNSGTGKSVISSTVIRKLIHDRPPSDDGTVAVGYFYFDFRDDKKQLVDTMLRSVVFQLSGQSLNPYAALNSQYEKLSRGQTLPTTQDLLDILDQLLLEFRHTYIVLDALDECRDTDLPSLVELLSKLRMRTEGSLHLLFTSQPREIFTAGFKGVEQIVLEPEATQKDIKHFVSDEIQSRLKQLKHWGGWKTRAEEIIAKVVEKSNGMFRLAACLIIEIFHHKLEPNLDTILANLPNELYGIYDRFLETFEGEDLVYLERILRWLLFSAEPLTLPELEDALAFDFSDPHLHVYDPSKQGNKAIILVGFLGGLVIVGESVEAYTGELTVVASLAHASVADYLNSDKFATKGRCDVSREHSHTFLAQTCVGYLLHFENHPCHFERQNASYCWHLTKQTSLEHPLVKYVAQYWSYHLLRCHDRAALSISTARLLVGGSRQYETLNKLYKIDLLRNSLAPLYRCSLIGYREGVEYLLRNGADVNKVGGEFYYALQAASANGHTDVIRVLLKNGADINMAGGEYGSALQAAAVRGHTEVVGILCEKGADINTAGGSYGSALQAAADGGHTEVVGILCEKGADLNAAGGFHGSALQAAAARGHTEVVGILIVKGAHVNTVGGGYYGSALQAAAAYGHTEVVGILCEKGANLNAAGGSYESALQVAAAGGHTEVVRILLENGADSNIAGGKAGSALQTASAKGSTDIVRFLVEQGANVNAVGGKHGSALQAASAKGHTDIIRILLENGADINSSDGLGNHGSALQIACTQGHFEAVRILIKHGADMPGDLLQIACTRGHVEVVRILIKHGANMLGDRLQIACTRGHVEVVRILIKHGADINAVGGLHGRPLQVVYTTGHRIRCRLDTEKMNVTSKMLLQGMAERYAEIDRILRENGAVGA